MDLYKYVAILFKDHPDLIADFSEYLPDVIGYGTAFSDVISDSSASLQHAESSESMEHL